MLEFNHKDWPDDGSDWDGIHDAAMKVILENREKLDNIGKELQKRIDDETAHLNHPKQIYRTVQHNCEYNLTVCKNLLALLESK